MRVTITGEMLQPDRNDRAGPEGPRAGREPEGPREGPRAGRERQFSVASRRSSTSDDRAIAQRARRQHAVVSLGQLVALGYSPRAVQRRADRGLLHRLFPGVYAVGHTLLSAKGRWMAAVLACGEGALLSHVDAAALHDLRTIPSGAIHVIAPCKRRLPGIHGHTHRLEAADQTVCDAIAVTTVERTVIDLAPALSQQRLRTLIENAMRRQVIDFAVLRPLAAAHAGRPGMPSLTAVLAELGDVAPRTDAGLAQRFLELIRDAGLPEPSVNCMIAGLEVDFHWPRQRVIVETDGWLWHHDRRSFEEDRRRDAVLLAAGWRVLRITNERLTHEFAAVLCELGALLGC